jgi:hypothetical protein
MEALRAGKEHIPTAKPHEVIFKFYATALNYRDLVIANRGCPSSVKDNVVPGPMRLASLRRLETAWSNCRRATIQLPILTFAIFVDLSRVRKTREI